jgi:hypothetical protein
MLAVRRRRKPVVGSTHDRLEGNSTGKSKSAAHQTIPQCFSEHKTMRIQHLLAMTAALFGLATTASGVEFYEFPDPEDSVEVIYPGVSGPFYPEANLIQGIGVGFEEDEPHLKIGAGELSDWVTTADCGFPADFIECVGMPIIHLDLGQDVPLDEISTWGYADSNTNGMREFELRFATSAEGTAGFGTSITYNPTFIVEDFFEYAAADRVSFEFTEMVTARYVEMTITDNYFDEPGDGTGENGWGPGGDRVGIGEIAFRIPEGNPDPLAPLDNGTLTDPTARANYVHNTLKTWIGDSNLDLVFDSSDLVAVFTAGQYEDAVIGNSTWRTGDWNGDKEFNSSDFVVAFGDGGYEQGPRAATAAVPEPSSLLLLLVGSLPLVRRRK